MERYSLSVETYQTYQFNAVINIHAKWSKRSWGEFLTCVHILVNGSENVEGQTDVNELESNHMMLYLNGNVSHCECLNLPAPRIATRLRAGSSRVGHARLSDGHMHGQWTIRTKTPFSPIYGLLACWDSALENSEWCHSELWFCTSCGVCVSMRGVKLG